MKKKNLKKVLLSTGILTTLLFISGCEKEYEEKNVINTTIENSAEVISTQIKDDIYTTEEVTTEKKTEQESTQNTNNITEQITEVSEDTKFDNFNTEVKNLNYFYDEQTYEKAKEYGRKTFIKMVDFIFYGTEINGITFNELNEESKAEILDNLRITDELIMKLDPDYKESVSEKYSVVKDFTKEKYNQVLDKVKDKIGEEKYDEIGQKKDEIIEKAKDKGNKAKEKTKTKVKSWYENFRDK